MYENLLILATFVFLYSLVSGGFERTPVNGAIVLLLTVLAQTFWLLHLLNAASKALV